MSEPLTSEEARSTIPLAHLARHRRADTYTIDFSVGCRAGDHHIKVLLNEYDCSPVRVFCACPVDEETLDAAERLMTPVHLCTEVKRALLQAFRNPESVRAFDEHFVTPISKKERVCEEIERAMTAVMHIRNFRNMERKRGTESKESLYTKLCRKFVLSKLVDIMGIPSPPLCITENAGVCMISVDSVPLFWRPSSGTWRLSAAVHAGQFGKASQHWQEVQQLLRYPLRMLRTNP